MQHSDSHELLKIEMRERGHGVIQCTLPFALEALTVASFARYGLELPFTLQSAVKKRQIEFLCGRYCAQACFKAHGIHPAPAIGFHDDRSPIWPPMWVGSISHTRGFASAVIGPRPAIWALGLDLENMMERVSKELIKQICADEQELHDIIAHLGCSAAMALTVIFSAKESFYKATYPRLQRFFGFHAARVLPHARDAVAVKLLTGLSDALPKDFFQPVELRLLPGRVLETLIVQLPPLE